MKYLLLSIIAISIFGTIMVPNAFSEDEEKLVVLETESGILIIKFFPVDAPRTMSNFLELVDSGYYDGTLFHRVINSFMIQGGDPNTRLSMENINMDASKWGTGGPGYSIAAEFNTIEHDRGIVSMARSAHPDSAGSQFFIVHQDSNFLDGEYTVFGRIITETSFETLDRIANLKTGDRDIPLDISKAVIYKAVSVPVSIAVPYLSGQYGVPNYEIQYALINKVCMPDGSGCTDYRPDRMITQSIMENVNTSSEAQGGGCLIATAAFGSEMAPQVQFLRELRDNTVLQTESGTSFMTGFNQFYYSFSPVIADYERENTVFKEAVKITLTPLLTSLALLQYADIDSESEMLGYGIGVILLNIGMYFVAPAVLIMKIRKRI